MVIKRELERFLKFIFRKAFVKLSPRSLPVMVAFAKTLADVSYHQPETGAEELLRRLETNQQELSIFLYRLGSELRRAEGSANSGPALAALHGLMRECCGCEIYFSTEIDTGFSVLHGQGTVIGSRHKIGIGFQIYQGCTIGHLKDDEPGAKIGSNVTLFANSSILGPVTIGDNVTIGAHSLVLCDVPERSVCSGLVTRATVRSS